MYKKAGELLERFANLSKNNDELKENIQNILFETGGVRIEKKQISVKGNTIFLKISPIKKSEVFLKKEKILAFLKNNNSTARITEIK